MKTVILAGGFGTRLSEYTASIPKPMVEVGGIPIICHIMNIYASYGHNDFAVALGYKSEVIKNYFLNFHLFNSDIEVDLLSGSYNVLNSSSLDWKVTLVDTGINTMTGGRLKRMKSLIGSETCMLTYGDGVSDINISDLLSFHRSHGKLMTVTAVHPPARFGELELDNDTVLSFKEKPQLHQGWINGGFFVIEPDFFELIDSDQTLLEREPMEAAAKIGQLMAFRHDGFWQCMDTKRDHVLLESLYSSGPPWKTL